MRASYARAQVRAYDAETTVPRTIVSLSPAQDDLVSHELARQDGEMNRRHGHVTRNIVDRQSIESGPREIVPFLVVGSGVRCARVDHRVHDPLVSAAGHARDANAPQPAHTPPILDKDQADTALRLAIQ